MKKFRLPRKVKKQIRKTLWLYPPDDKGNSLVAWPEKTQEDFDAMKKGIVQDIQSRAYERLEE